MMSQQKIAKPASPAPQKLRVLVMDALAKAFGVGKKGQPPTAREAIVKLKETEDLLGKKSEYVEEKIQRELASARKHGSKNKSGA